MFFFFGFCLYIYDYLVTIKHIKNSWIFQVCSQNIFKSGSFHFFSNIYEPRKCNTEHKKPDTKGGCITSFNEQFETDETKLWCESQRTAYLCGMWRLKRTKGGTWVAGNVLFLDRVTAYRVCSIFVNNCAVNLLFLCSFVFMINSYKV